MGSGSSDGRAGTCVLLMGEGSLADSTQRALHGAGASVLRVGDPQELRRLSLRRARALAAVTSDEVENISIVGATLGIREDLRILLRAGRGEVTNETESPFKLGLVHDVNRIGGTFLAAAAPGSEARGCVPGRPDGVPDRAGRADRALPRRGGRPSRHGGRRRGSEGPSGRRVAAPRRARRPAAYPLVSRPGCPSQPFLTMSTPATHRAAEESPSASIGDFDHHADTYREDVEKAIAWSGRDVDYFAEGKAELLLSLVARRLGDPSSLRALDVGCGVGVTDRFLDGRFAQLHGVDLAADAVEQARAANPSVDYRTYEGGRLPFDDDAVDVAFTICVLHHVPPAEWAPFARELRRVVRTGGLVVVFEHNPLNPLTRVSVSRCPFDEDVTLLRAGTTERLLGEVGLGDPERRFFFFLPLRKIAESRIERALCRVPLGAQYYVAATA